MFYNVLLKIRPSQNLVVQSSIQSLLQFLRSLMTLTHSLGTQRGIPIESRGGELPGQPICTESNEVDTCLNYRFLTIFYKNRPFAKPGCTIRDSTPLPFSSDLYGFAITFGDPKGHPNRIQRGEAPWATTYVTSLRR